MARVIEAPTLDEDELQTVYEWVDEIPLSRPKRNMTRDFADGLLLAEVVKHYFPRLVELHNYPAAHSVQQRVVNWKTLNTKVFRRMGFQVANSDLQKIANAEAEAVERVLSVVRQFLLNFKEAGLSPEPSPPKLAGKGFPKRVSPEQAVREKAQLVQGLRDAVEVMETKILKLEQLVSMKNAKIEALTDKLVAAGFS